MYENPRETGSRGLGTLLDYGLLVPADDGPRVRGVGPAGGGGVGLVAAYHGTAVKAGAITWTERVSSGIAACGKYNGESDAGKEALAAHGPSKVQRAQLVLLGLAPE